MKLYKGLPLKTITDKEGVEHIFGVSTETVDDLIFNFLLSAQNEDLQGQKEIEEFDNSFSYGVPQEIFEQDDETIIKYIVENIDDNFYI